MESTEAMESTMESAESAGVHASPTVKAVSSGRPAAQAAGVAAQAAESG